jgi:hypothetical protein
MHICIPWIHKFVIAKIGCGISHKDTKHTVKSSSSSSSKQQQQQQNKTK